MSTTQEGNIAASFHLIHNIITRGLGVSIESIQGVLSHGFHDESSREGLFNYIRALTSVLNAHHLGEEEIAFPYFREKMPGVDFDSLVYWHNEMVKILDEINLAVEKCAQHDPLEKDLKDLENALVRLNEMWLPHIQYETDDFISKADALVPVEEQLRLIGLFAEHGMKIAVPHYWTVPFTLYNLPPEDRLVFSQGMPALVVQHLVPVVWKAQWESMKPYLLE